MGREFQRRREAFRKERSKNLSLDVSGGRERQRLSTDRVWPVGLIYGNWVEIYEGDCG